MNSKWRKAAPLALKPTAGPPRSAPADDPAQLRRPTLSPLRTTAREQYASARSLDLSVPYGQGEPVGQAERPHIHVSAVRRELPSVASYESNVVAEVVIQPELKHIRGHSWQRIVLAGSCVKLLHPRDHLDVP